MAEPFLSIQHVRKSFGATTVVEDFNLDVAPGEFVSFLGPSGCGKTTLLNIISGLLHPSHGQLLFNGRDITNLSTQERNIAQVF
ncbi:MAG: ABC transporter ATP-binding protein, partial [Mesorhizobium sp.]